MRDLGREHIAAATFAPPRDAAARLLEMPSTEISVRSTPAGSDPVGISIRCIASPIRGLPFKYEPQDRRFNGGIGRRHRRTVGAAGQFGVQPETGVVQRLRALRG